MNQYVKCNPHTALKDAAKHLEFINPQRMRGLLYSVVCGCVCMYVLVKEKNLCQIKKGRRNGDANCSVFNR